LAGRIRLPPHVDSMTTGADVAEMLAQAERARSMAQAARSPEYKRLLADIAADYERLAYYRLIILDTERHLADSRRMVGDAIHLG
jgi:hypothetical protein